MDNKWAYYWANKYRWALEMRNDIDLEDLVQAALMGEYIAKQTYDPDRGPFARYSTFFIKKEIRTLLGIRNGDIPPSCLSLDEPLNAETETTRGDILEDDTLPDNDEIAYLKERRDGVRAAIQRLPEQRRSVMWQFYIQGKGSAEIGKAMGLPPSRILHILAAGRQSMYRDKLLRQLAGISRPYYVHIGLNTFKTTHTSAVEYTYFQMEAEAERIMQQIQRLKEQDAQEDYCKQEDKVV